MLCAFRCMKQFSWEIGQQCPLAHCELPQAKAGGQQGLGQGREFQEAQPVLGRKARDGSEPKSSRYRQVKGHQRGPKLETQPRARVRAEPGSGRHQAGDKVCREYACVAC